MTYRVQRVGDWYYPEVNSRVLFWTAWTAVRESKYVIISMEHTPDGPMKDFRMVPIKRRTEVEAWGEARMHAADIIRAGKPKEPIIRTVSETKEF